MKDKLLYTIKVGYMVYRLQYADDDEANLRQNMRKTLKLIYKVKQQVVARALLIADFYILLKSVTKRYVAKSMLTSIIDKALEWRTQSLCCPIHANFNH